MSKAVAAATALAAMNRIDAAKPFRICGYITRLSDHLSVGATDQLFLPGTADFLGWLSSKQAWMQSAFANLQGLRETHDGSPLLTTWLAPEDFWSMLDEGRDNPVIDDIAIRALHWRSTHIDEVCLDLFKKTPSATPLIRRT